MTSSAVATMTKGGRKQAWEGSKQQTQADDDNDRWMGEVHKYGNWYYRPAVCVLKETAMQSCQQG